MAGSNRIVVRPATVALVVAAVACVVLAIVYFTTAASSLPSLVPGHDAASARHHTKHGIAMLCLALAALVGAWLTTGQRASR